MGGQQNGQGGASVYHKEGADCPRKDTTEESGWGPTSKSRSEYRSLFLWRRGGHKLDIPQKKNNIHTKKQKKKRLY